ncbi:TAT-binding protein-like protein 7, AAA ATPase [Recurvomyces mirabilis]|uniref:TAT-binding protein-like protein 7, AAA ATPase n=1 Tax=Recurvomyces mirabilis TaxID=574656 RepID=A0AAE0WJZ3_9PEZI|nr:TAT-binding protein-like protein 7, AAA ATPase [Recurvomyces mirabilis]KAK5153344.1 TAT-binding protein-like protein 7, AAA ATPase [Recurvomyces mirabilis]
MEQEMDCPASRALMCGRRMFLSALILASKYLQDRNYSAKAWSKMSGLPVKEINTNERTFLGKICWKLHIAEAVFKRWTDVVLKYSPHSHPPSPGQPGFSMSWKAIVPVLTAELDTVPMPETKTPVPAPSVPNYDFSSPVTPTPTKMALNPIDIQSTSHESTPTSLAMLPRFLEPRTDIAPPTPALARMGPLPTPQMTPSTVGSSTPAVSACGLRRSSMHAAVALMQKANLNRCAYDAYPFAIPVSDRYTSRRPSISAMSTGSSPESMISDLSTTSSLALGRACLARQATCRNAGRLTGLPAAVREEKEGSVAKPIVIADDTEMTLSPEVVDFTVSDKVLHAPHRHSKHAPHHVQPVTASSTTDKGRKRARPKAGRRSDLQDEIRFQLEQDYDDDMMDVDNDTDDVSPSPATDYATRMLSQDAYGRKVEAQPSPSLAKQKAARIPMQKNEGKKRTCCTATTMSISPSPSAIRWGEVA